MIRTLHLLPGVTFRAFRDSRFKQGCLSFQMIRPMGAEEASLNAILPSVLLRGTQRHRDLRSITEHLDLLYGASVGTLVRRVGDRQTVGLYCGFMDDRFALPGDKVLGPMLAFLEELLLEPLVEGDAFLPEIVDSEKKNLIATIESELNDKRAYAMGRLLRTMCREDSFGLPRLGKKEDVAAIQPGALYRHYRKILRESPIEVFYVGSGDPEMVADILKEMLTKVDRTPVDMPPQMPLKPGPGSDVTEQMDVAQGKLCMGFTTPITNRSPGFPAMQLLNALFGAGMTSKLFMNVREKLSLCYSVGSGYYSTKGILTVSAGIDFDKEDRTREEILRQLDACRTGDITEEELNAARAALLSSLRGTHDSPGAIEGYYSTGVLSGLSMTREGYMLALEGVTKEQVVAAANTLKLHTTYFLKGESQ